MLTLSEQELVRAHARVPEHIVAYVTALSGGEPFLSGDFLFYLSGRSLIFVGYPLRGETDAETLAAALRDAVGKTRPESVSLVTPLGDGPTGEYEMRGSDAYYSLSLPVGPIGPKLANLLRRASRDLQIRRGRIIDDGHRRLLGTFLATRQLDPQTGSLLSMIPRYVKATDTAVVFTAYDTDRRAVGFSVADYWSDRCAFYMFNITSKEHRTPGMSDLLLREIIQEAQASGKAWINLGLGINKGITFFKTKWGAEPRFAYYYFYNPSPRGKGPAAFFRNLLQP